MNKNSNLTKLQKGALNFDSLICNIFAPKFLEPAKDEFKDHKLRYFAKRAAKVCWAGAVCIAAVNIATIAPVPMALVATSVVMGRAYASKNRRKVPLESLVATSQEQKPPMNSKQFKELSCSSPTNNRSSATNNRSNSNGGSSKKGPTAEFLSKCSGKSNG